MIQNTFQTDTGPAVANSVQNTVVDFSDKSRHLSATLASQAALVYTCSVTGPKPGLKSQVTAMEVLPVFFRLCACQDKNLRQLLFRHIIAGDTRPPLPPPPSSDSW